MFLMCDCFPRQSRNLKAILEMENKIRKVYPQFCLAKLLITLSPRMRIGVERGLLLADASCSEEGWKAG